MIRSIRRLALVAGLAALHALAAENEFVRVSSADGDVPAAGEHEVETIYAPCPECGQRRNPSVETKRVAAHFDGYDWTFAVGGSKQNVTGGSVETVLPDLPKGERQVAWTCTASRASCTDCSGKAEGKTCATVHELTLTCGEWIGIDRTDGAESITVATNIAQAVLTPELPGAKCVWDSAGLKAAAGHGL